ncbi:MAG: VWA domain-containing protein [Rhodobacterales bacterium]|nr:VWA domain-containing protein [Rhodobacterales bacterium]
MIPMGFERPEFLWLLLLWLPLAALGWFSKRKINPRRRALAMGLRTALLLTIVLALSELTWKRPVDDLAVVFVMDRSASVSPSAIQNADNFVTEALKSQGDNDLAGMVVFGADALVEAEPQAEWRFHGSDSTPNRHQTDLSSGLRLGTALLPADRTRRIVLLSDGEQTRGDAAAQALQLSGEDLRVSVVTVGREEGPEVWLADLVAPARVDEGAAYEVRVVADAELPADATLRLYRNDTYFGAMPVSLDGKRAKVLVFKQEAEAGGLYRYRAVLEVDDPSLDTLPQNNQVVSTVQVNGRPRVLIAEGDAGQARNLAAVLERDGLAVDIVGPDAIPAGLADLRPYSAVVLSDIPAYNLTNRQMEALRSYVRDLGRGLVMIGGDRSFGVGGYFHTPVEEALPVRMDIEDKTRFPKLGMVLAIDKSCSMGGGAGSKLGLAREASIRTAELLSDRDMLGVIGFDGAASWVAPLRELTQRQAILDDIAGLRPGGGTDIYPALVEAIDALDSSDAALKHIILISDGMTSAGAYETLLRDAHSRDLTLTSVGIGADADSQTMKDFATWGGGNFYLVIDANAIPAIFTRETLLASRSFLVEETFTPAFATPSELTRGVAALPPLHGYIATEAKQRSTVAMTVPDEAGDLPLLAHWRHGLGRSVAFTSDAKGRWGRDWVGSPSYTALWTQTIRWAVGDPEAPNIAIDTDIVDGDLVITADAFDAMGGFQNFLDGEARVVSPNLEVQNVVLEQVAPGRYQARIPVDQDGSWLVGIALRDGEQVIGQAVSEAVQPYSPEYRAKGAGGAIMDEIGRVGGGGTLTNPDDVFRRPDVVRTVPRPLWPLLVALAGLLLLIDVAVRRLDLFRGRGQMIVSQPAAAAPRTPFQAAVKRQKAAKAKTEAVEVEEDDAAPPPPAAPTVDADSYAGRLLAARSKARHNRKDS